MRGQRNGRKGAIEQMCQTCRASGDELISIPTKLTMFSFGQVVAADRSTLVESGFDILAAIFFEKHIFPRTRNIGVVELEQNLIHSAALRWQK